MSGKIVYGEYKISDAIGQIVGWSTEEDLKLSEIGDTEERPLGGETVQEIHSNHGWQAQGTVVVTAPEGFVARRGTVLAVERNGERYFFTVREWENSLDTETGGVVAAVTLEGRDSMQEEYQIGPRDPDTGEPLSNKAKTYVAIDFATNEVDASFWQGAVAGLFVSPNIPTSTALPDMGKAVTTSTIIGGQAVFVTNSGVSGLAFAAVKEGKWIMDDTAPTPTFAAGSVAIVNADEWGEDSDSSSST